MDDALAYLLVSYKCNVLKVLTASSPCIHVSRRRQVTEIHLRYLLPLDPSLCEGSLYTSGLMVTGGLIWLVVQVYSQRTVDRIAVYNSEENNLAALQTDGLRSLQCQLINNTAYTKSTLKSYQ